MASAIRIKVSSRGEAWPCSMRLYDAMSIPVRSQTSRWLRWCAKRTRRI